MKNCFVIVNHNDYKSTNHLVDNIKNYKVIDKILIVDNNSSVEEKKLLETITSKKVEVLYLDDNYGYSYAINSGTRYLLETYETCNFIISNSDIIIMSENDIIKLLETLNNPKIGLVGPQIMELGTITKGYKCPSPFIDGLCNFKFFKNILADKYLYYKEDYYETPTSEVDIINSCFFLIASDTLKRINYLDENVFLYYEDYIMGKKVKELGLLSVIVNDVKIKHLYSISVDRVLKQIDKLKLLHKSQFYFHTTYNDTNELEKIFLNVTARMSIFFKKLSSMVKKI